MGLRGSRFSLDYNGGQMQEQSDPVNKNKNGTRHFI